MKMLKNLPNFCKIWKNCSEGDRSKNRPFYSLKSIKNKKLPGKD